MPHTMTGDIRQRTLHAPWPLAELVRAQRLACEGHSVDAIAQALGRTAEEVRRRLEPEPKPHRQEFANLGHRHLKDR